MGGVFAPMVPGLYVVMNVCQVGPLAALKYETNNMEPWCDCQVTISPNEADISYSNNLVAFFYNEM